MSKVISSVDCSIILLGSLLLEKINEPCVIKQLLFFFFLITFENEGLCSFNLLYTCLIKHFTRDTNPQNGFVTWSLHSSSAFHSNKRSISQSSQNFLTILPKKKRRKKETKIALFHFLRAHYESMVDGGGNGNLLQYSCWENPMDRGAWQAIVHGVASSQTWLITWIDDIISDWTLKFDKYVFFWSILEMNLVGCFFFLLLLFLCFLFQKMINII